MEEYCFWIGNINFSVVHCKLQEPRFFLVHFCLRQENECRAPQCIPGYGSFVFLNFVCLWDWKLNVWVVYLHFLTCGGSKTWWSVDWPSAMTGPQSWLALTCDWPSAMAGLQLWLALSHGWPSAMGGPQSWLALSHGWPSVMAGSQLWLALSHGWPSAMAGPQPRVMAHCPWHQLYTNVIWVSMLSPPELLEKLTLGNDVDINISTCKIR